MPSISRPRCGWWTMPPATAAPAMIREGYPQVALIASAENLGFAEATNLGLAAVRRDARPPATCAAAQPRHAGLPRCADADGHLPGRSTVRGQPSGAQLVYGDGSFQHGAFRFPTLWMAFFDFWTINHRLINSRLNGRYPRRRYDAGQPFRDRPSARRGADDPPRNARQSGPAG